MHRDVNLNKKEGAPLFPQFSPSSPLPLEVGPILWLGGLGALKLPSRSGQSPAAKRFWCILSIIFTENG